MRTWFIIMIFLASIATGHSQKIEVKENWWGTTVSQNDQNLEFTEIQRALQKNQEAFALISNAGSNRTIGAIIGMAGSALIAFPIGEAVAGEDFNWTMAGIGAGFLGLSIPFNSITKQFSIRAIDSYNAGLPYPEGSEKVFQQKRDRPFSVGIKAGTNISRLDFNSTRFESENTLDIHVGALGDLKLYRSLHLQVEALYSREGAKDQTLTYFNLPVLLKWYYLSDFQLHLGPQFGFLLSAQENEEDFKSQALSGVFGTGYESPGGILFDVRYSVGLSGILVDDFLIPSGSGYTISGIDAWSQNFQLSLGYKF